MEGIKNVFFKWKVVAVWAFFSVYQSLIFYYFVSTASISAKNSAGLTFGVWDVSTMAFTCVVVTVNLRLLMICNSVTKWHSISVGGSILAWFIFAFIYSAIIRQVNSLPLFTKSYFAVYQKLCYETYLLTVQTALNLGCLTCRRILILSYIS